MNPQLKQRIIGGCVLLAILVIFLPILFHNNHNRPRLNQNSDVSATQPEVELQSPSGAKLSDDTSPSSVTSSTNGPVTNQALSNNARDKIQGQIGVIKQKSMALDDSDNLAQPEPSKVKQIVKKAADVPLSLKPMPQDADLNEDDQDEKDNEAEETLPEVSSPPPSPVHHPKTKSIAANKKINPPPMDLENEIQANVEKERNSSLKLPPSPIPHKKTVAMDMEKTIQADIDNEISNEPIINETESPQASGNVSDSASDRTSDNASDNRRIQESQESGSEIAQNDEVSVSQQQNGAWVLQLATFSNRHNAELLAKKLRAKGFDAYVSSSKGKNNSHLMRVLVGPDIQLTRIKQIQRRLKTEFGLNGIIRKYEA